jgi:hypothetical protein
MGFLRGDSEDNGTALGVGRGAPWPVRDSGEEGTVFAAVNTLDLSQVGRWSPAAEVRVGFTAKSPLVRAMPILESIHRTQLAKERGNSDDSTKGFGYDGEHG